MFDLQLFDTRFLSIITMKYKNNNKKKKIACKVQRMFTISNYNRKIIRYIYYVMSFNWVRLYVRSKNIKKN